MRADGLDKYARGRPPPVRQFERALEKALSSISPMGSEGVKSHLSHVDDAARLFLQRVLYRINRLKLFWYDDLRNYDNERSSYLQQVRDRVEQAWQAWELSLLDVDALTCQDARE